MIITIMRTMERGATTPMMIDISVEPVEVVILDDPSDVVIDIVVMITGFTPVIAKVVVLTGAVVDGVGMTLGRQL